MFDRFSGDIPGDGGHFGLGNIHSQVTPLVFSPDGRTLAIGLEGIIHLWDLADHRELHRLVTGPVFCGWAVDFSPDGRLLALGHRGAFSLTDVRTGAVLCRVDGHGGAVTCLGFSADGRRLITGSADTTALVWDVPALLTKARKQRTEPADRDLEALWQNLGDPDGSRAERALWALAAAPGRAVSFLRERLRPVPPVEKARLARLVADLGSERFTIRERATRELERLGDVAVPALKRTLEGGGGLELRRRAEQLLHKANGPVTEPERLRPLLAVEALERIGTAEAREILEDLVRGAPGARLTEESRAALRRLAKQSPERP
jgi:hypothetical protein